jgi:hypothetical protein
LNLENEFTKLQIKIVTLNFSKNGNNCKFQWIDFSAAAKPK